MDIGPLIVCTLGGLLLLLGLIGSFAPVLPGPPLSALGALVLQGGLSWGWPDSAVGWAFAALSAMLGAVLTVAELLAPAAVGRLGGSSREAAVGATIGIVVGMVIGCGGGGVASVLTLGMAAPGGAGWTFLWLVLGPFVGGYIGEYNARGPEDPDRARGALRAGLAHAVAILVGTVVKIGYGMLAVGFGALQVILALR
jgi:uncharacterized protein YqgC (DUF456 family)